MEPMTLLLTAGALIVGVAGGLLFARARSGSQTSELIGRAQAAERELQAVREMHEQQLHSERHSAAERLHAEVQAAADRLESERSTAAERLDRREQEWSTRLAEEREAAAQRVQELREDTKRIADEFEALSRKALESNSRTFLDQAVERLKRSEDSGSAELAKREEAIKQLVEPLQRTLGEVKQEMTEAERARLEAHTALREQVQTMRESSDSLRLETSQLVTALRAPQVRGQWGEIQLRRTVEMAGMVEHVDFEEQVQLDGGAARPDLIVTLPGDKQIVVDAKVAFGGYLEAMEARDESTRAERLNAHARHLRTHVDQLAGKEYFAHLDSAPEFTVMFIPSQVFLDAALERDPSIMEHAFSKNVVLATPATLVALLRTVAYTWRQENLAAEAQQVFTVGRELHKRLATFGKHLDTVAKRLNSTVDAFNKMTTSLDARVVPQVQRFSSLQGLDAAMDVPVPLEVMATPARKEDLFSENLPELSGRTRSRARRAATQEEEALRDATDQDDDGEQESQELIAAADAVARRVAGDGAHTDAEVERTSA